jgi:Thaumarchaeal output domain 1
MDVPDGPLGPTPDQDPTDGILVVAARGTGSEDLVVDLRKDPLTRLMPIIVVHPGVGTIKGEPLADVHVPMQPGSLRDALLLMGEYFERVQRLQQPMDLLPSEQQELDLLRFIHTRELKEIKPTMDGSSSSGFRYPVPEALLDLDPLSTLRVLTEYESRGLLTGRIEERIYLCASCSSSRLIFREICPKCRRPVLTSRPTIHHFRCAYTGKIEEFQSGANLLCPKCQRLLRHIGVDYDMPDSTLECGACAEQWVEGHVQARCLDCDHRCSPEEANLTDVRAYSPTPSMHRAAKDPVPPLSTPNKLLMTALQTLEPATYGIILDHTIRVCERYERPAAVLQVSIEGLTEGHHREGRAGLNRLIDNVSMTIRSNIRSTDLIHVNEDNTIDILLIETDQARAEEMRQRLQEQTQHLEALNLRLSFHIITLP